MWICPHCRLLLQLDTEARSWKCAGNHQFDCAKEGYVNLLPANSKRTKEPGDSAQMVAARRRVHDLGLYQPLAAAVIEQLQLVGPGDSILDLGCGEGFYTGAVAEAFPTASVAGVDIAKTAIRLAAKRHQKASFAVASTFSLPVADASQDAVIRVFAPSDDADMQRALKSDGVYIEVTPATEHLWELRQNLYTRSIGHAPPRREISGMTCIEEREVGFELELNPQQISDVLSMTPFAFKGHREKRKRLLQMEVVQVKMAFNILAFRPR